jgi:hypothetical protein
MKNPSPRVTLAFEPQDVAANVRSFGPAVAKSQHLQGRLSHVRAWYAVRDGEDWLFGPSKWAGYQGMTAQAYLDPADGLDGRQTEKHLNKWFEFLPEKSPEHRKLLKELGAFTAQYGKAPSRACRISIIREASDESNGADDLVALLIKVARRLGTKEKAQIVKALQY